MMEEDFYGEAHKDLPYGALTSDTSLYMSGSVSVSVILPESDETSTNSENWTPEEIANVHAEVINGLDWWAANNPDADLVFVYNFEDQVPTQVEPIELIGSTTGRCQWMEDVFITLGLDPMPTWFDCLPRSYEYANGQRDLKGTDWHFTAFVIDSSNDLDGRFADGYFAFTIFSSTGGGPYMVVTYDNYNYGIDNMDAVTAHETGHIFGALDQYYPCACTDHTGYLYYENQNCVIGCSIAEESIMKSITGPFSYNYIDVYAKGQIGWQDTDGRVS